MTINRPGIDVQFSSLKGSTRALAAPTINFLVGYAQWGPVNTPTFISDKRELYGRFGTTLPGAYLVSDAIHYFDTSGGTGRLWAVRGFEFGVDVGTGNPKTADAYTAKAVLSAGATPVLSVGGTYAGALGNTFRLDVFVDPNGVKKVVLWSRGGSRVITWSAVQQKVVDQIAAINAAAVAGLSDFTVAMPGAFSAIGPDVTTSATNITGPTATSIPLIGGSDGETANFPLSALIGGINSTTFKSTGLEALNSTDYGPGTVSIPGYTPTLALTAALDLHVRANYRLAVVSLRPNGNAVMRAIDAVTLKNALTQSSFIAYNYPDVYDLDGVLSPMDGYVSGKAAANQSRVDAEGGVKASVTGTLPITGVVQVGDRDPVRDADAELLYANGINYVRFIRGTGYRLDSQLLSAQEGAISRIHHRMITMKLYYDVTEALVQFRDRTIDQGGRLQGDIKFALEQLLEPYQPGKLAPKGNTFFNPSVVVTDNSIQTAADLEQGLLHITVEGSLSPKSERISLLFNVNPIVLG